MKCLRIVLMMVAAACAGPLAAQPNLADIREIPAPPLPPSIPLGTGDVPGMPPESWSASGANTMVRNVSQARLTPILPDPAKATGAAVIVAPGGAFYGLAMESEGFAVGRALAERGVTAFVLTYRVRPTPEDTGQYLSFIAERIAQARAGNLDSTVPAASIEDAKAAFRMVRARSGEWQVDPARIGMMGFSAGAMLVVGFTLQASLEEMPAFIAPIYGPMKAVTVPANAPPMFAAIAADDPHFGMQGFGLVEGWRAAGRPAELHVYQAGGHGYGLGRPGTTTFGWINSFMAWLDLNGVLGEAAGKANKMAR